MGNPPASSVLSRLGAVGLLSLPIDAFMDTQSIKGTRRGLRRRERANSAMVMELWTEKERKVEEEEKKRMRQKEEECDEIFKRSKLVERSPNRRVERENKAGYGTKELKDLKNDLKQEIAGLRKEVKEIKEEWKKSMEGLEKRIDTMEKKIKEIERATIDRSKEE